MLALSISRDLVLDHRLPAPANLAFHVIFMTFAATGILSARESYHKFAVIIVSGIFVAYVVMLFSFAMNELVVEKLPARSILADAQSDSLGN